MQVHRVDLNTKKQFAISTKNNKNKFVNGKLALWEIKMHLKNKKFTNWEMAALPVKFGNILH